MTKNLMIIAGEVSGDLHGASLINELKKLDNNINIFGVGGDKMQAAGMNVLFHIDKMAFLGFVEVVKHLPFIKKVQKDLLGIIKEKNINNVVLIDYPGFNLSIAKKIKKINLHSTVNQQNQSKTKNNVKIIYYIAPQIWAWGAGRIKKIKKLVDRMLVVFPFEEEVYKYANIKVDFVGHPLLERINNYNFLSKEELFKKFDLQKDKEILLLLPGSRLHEVEKIFPDAIKAALTVSEKFGLQSVVACSSNINENIFFKISGQRNFKVVKNYTYDLLKYSKLGIIKSGTSTLEAGLFELPMVIVYKTNYLTYLIGKNLVKVNNIGMVNIIAGVKIAPELIQNQFTEHTLIDECSKILSTPELYLDMKTKLKSLKEKLGISGASGRAAHIIYDMMNES